MTWATISKARGQWRGSGAAADRLSGEKIPLLRQEYVDLGLELGDATDGLAGPLLGVVDPALHPTGLTLGQRDAFLSRAQLTSGLRKLGGGVGEAPLESSDDGVPLGDLRLHGTDELEVLLATRLGQRPVCLRLTGPVGGGHATTVE